MISIRSVLSGMIALALLAPAAGAQSVDASVPAAPAVAGVPSPATAAIVGATEHTAQPESQDAQPAHGPTLDGATAGIRPAPASATLVPGSAEQQGSFGRAETLMIVGGAAFVAGLIIGDDAGTIVMVSGAAIGLYGLYLYLQTH